MLPQLSIQVDGQGAVSAEDYNSKTYWAVNVANLRAFTGLGGMTVWMQGTTAPNDGGQGNFFYDPNATAPDDNGATTIQPTGVTGNGRWIRQPQSTGSIPANSVTLGQIQQIGAGTVLANTGTATGNVSAVPIADIVTTAPTGSIIAWTTQAAPSGWLICDGSAVSRTTYAALNAVAASLSYGDPYGAGDGSTTFNLPDTRGYFLRGWDSSGVIDPGRTFGSTQESALEKHVHTTDTPSVYVGVQTNPFGSSTVSVTRTGFTTAGTGSNDLGLTNDGTTYSSYNPNPGGQVSGNETRPINLALTMIIKF
jgi:microcystin-dependent protein